MAVSRARLGPLVGIALGLGLLLAGSASAGKGDCEHTVVKGDTLSRIAKKHGVSEASLLKANPAVAKNPHRLRVGQRIELCKAKRIQATRPQKCGEGGAIATHRVGKGETLGAIAARYSVSRDSVRKYNPQLKKRSNDMIRVGEVLRICTTNRRHTHRSWLVGGVQLSSGEGYVVRRPDNAWGIPTAIAGIEAAIARYRTLEPDAPLVQVGDVSRKNGGPLRDHLSHQEGRDVDIGYVFELDEDGRKTGTIDIPRTWSLVSSFIEDENVAVIFVDYRLQARLYEHARWSGVDQARLDEVFEYPRKGDGDAILYHWRGHTRHFHVRFHRTPQGSPPEQS